MLNAEQYTIKELNNLLKEIEKRYKSLFKSLSKEYRELQDIIADMPSDEIKKAMYLKKKDKKIQNLVSRIATKLADANSDLLSEIDKTTQNVYQYNYNYEGYLASLRLNDTSMKPATKAEIKEALKSIKTPSGEEDAKVKRNKMITYFKIALVVSRILTEMDSTDRRTSSKVKEEMDKNINKDADSLSKTATWMNIKASSIATINAGKDLEKAGFVINKKWLSTFDTRTRASHRALQGEIVPLDGVFSNGLRYPVDTSGPIKEWIRCRCTLALDYVNYEKSEKEIERDIDIKRKKKEYWGLE